MDRAHCSVWSHYRGRLACASHEGCSRTVRGLLGDGLACRGCCVVACVASGLKGHLLVGGGTLCCGVGTIFFIRGLGLRYAHGIWHPFVLGGSASHYAAIFLLLT